MNKRLEWSIVTMILLLAAALRLWALGEVPPGLAHDEVANWLIACDILAGNHAIYFTAAYGHEPLYQYTQAATVALFGDHWLGLRWPSVAFGLLGIAATYAFVRRLLGASIALLTAAWLAASFWPMFYARVALRAITLPFTAALCAYFLVRATDSEHGLQDANGSRQSRSAHSPHPGGVAVVNWLLAGIFLGLSFYTYMAVYILPVILVAFLVYWALLRRPAPFPWLHIFAFLLVAALVAAPIVTWLATHLDAVQRFSEIRKPLDRLLAGNPALVWRNLIANLKFFTIAGDPWPRQGIPGRPVFADPISAALFYAGLLIAVWRWRDPRYGLLLLWLVGALAPSVVTSVAPSSIRDILGLVVAFVFPALALVEAGRWLVRRMPETGGFLLLASCPLLLAPCIFLTACDYFLLWPQNDVVRFDYQTDLTAVAHRLDELPPETPVAVAGVSVFSMDGPGLELATQGRVRHVRLCDTRETLVVPGGHDVWLFVPQVVPFDADLQERLLAWGATTENDESASFAIYHLSDDASLRRALEHLETTATLPDGAAVSLPVSFGERRGAALTFLGYEQLPSSPIPGGSLTLLTYWRVEAPPSSPLKIFVHLLDKSGAPIAQHDGLGSPPDGWAAGDLIVQKHTVSLPADLAPGPYALQVGLYDAATGDRLPVLTADRLLLYSLEVSEW
jgi:4-amino-4-deoxy-L-arabinose transferase-like glycosyltransferase